jgi:hypothetical protein
VVEQEVPGQWSFAEVCRPSRGGDLGSPVLLLEISHLQQSWLDAEGQRLLEDIEHIVFP